MSTQLLIVNSESTGACGRNNSRVAGTGTLSVLKEPRNSILIPMLGLSRGNIKHSDLPLTLRCPLDLLSCEGYMSYPWINWRGFSFFDIQLRLLGQNKRPKCSVCIKHNACLLRKGDARFIIL